MSEEIILRQSKIDSFIKEYFANDKILIEKLKGDAGFRNYYRIIKGDKSYIFMDCPPSYNSITPFINIANYLSSNKLRAPKIYSADEKNGFIILEDFGCKSARDYLIENNNPQDVRKFYYTTIDILVYLQKLFPPENLRQYTNELLLEELNLFLDWYVPYVNGKKLDKPRCIEFKEIWQNILNARPNLPSTIVLRDYHVENMMIIANKASLKNIGLLDFQDALIGSPIYDLVSILEDARIKVNRKVAEDCINYFSNESNLSYDDVYTEHCILGAQRNLRIVGVFARKAIRDNMPKYLSFIPRMLSYLEFDFAVEEMQMLKDWFNDNIEKFEK